MLYASIQAFVIVAENEQRARTVAAWHRNYGEPEAWWLDTKLTTCEEIITIGDERVIIADTPTG